MLLQLPLWRYPAVVIFSVLMHGILVLILFSEYRRDPVSTQIEWFELREMQLPKKNNTQASASSPAMAPASKKPERIPVKSEITVQDSKLDELPTVIIPPVTKKPFAEKKLTKEPASFSELKTPPAEEEIITLVPIQNPIPAEVIQEDMEETLLETNPETSIQQTIPVLEEKSASVFSLDEVLQQTKNFPKKTEWNETMEGQAVSNSLGNLLSGIRMVRLSVPKKEEEQNMRLDSLDAQTYLQDLNHFFAQHWEVPLHLAESELTVVVRIRIDKAGRIEKTKIETSSGDAELDHSVSRLLKNLQSLPSLPYSYLGHFYEFGIKFTPRDLQF